jgi:hypothetical protein
MSLLAAHSSRVGPRTMWASKDITLTSSYGLLLSMSEIETAIDKCAGARAFKGRKTVQRVLLARLRAAVRAKTCHPTNNGPPPQSSLRSVLNFVTNPSTRYSNRRTGCTTMKVCLPIKRSYTARQRNSVKSMTRETANVFIY